MLRESTTEGKLDSMTATTTISIQPGTAFWLLLFVLIVGMVMRVTLGNEKMDKIMPGGWQDAFGRWAEQQPAAHQSTSSEYRCQRTRQN